MQIKDISGRLWIWWKENKQLFKTPMWLLDQNILAKINPDNGVELIKSIQDGTLSNLLSLDRMARLMETSSMNKANYSIDELMSDLKRGIFSELRTNTAIDVYRRNLQKAFVSKLIDAISLDKNAAANFNGRRIVIADTDLPSIARGHLIELRSQLKAANALATDRLSKFHMADLVARIDKALNPNR